MGLKRNPALRPPVHFHGCKTRISGVLTISSANPATLEGYGLYRLPHGLIAPIAFKIGEELVHKYRNKSEIAGNTKFQ